ncbi:GATA zinc finger domain-containing protein 14-like [Chelonus insularis]|uniref:GATA zinc finger domain-containing protein 14-like n=1 Tax=Chelonus insularis TaxID=460826 RepID=UPI00158F580C|nr:GATA zinc finger domain-containing protein 14-like [Chelonus insularis]
MSLKNLVFISIAGILWCCALGLQRPPPRYSQQFMPETSFTCRNKIVGSYYADPEADCQLFHVCVSVAGLIQDYKFLCPNDTAFDQESQTCANWYDVDCEAATLYYASDNFDLYRIGSGLESLHYDMYRSDAEPQDHLQRSETNDPVRSAANNYNRVAQNNYNNQNNNNNNNNNKNNNYNSDNYNNQKGDILRGSSSSNFYNSRNNGKEEDYDNEKNYEPIVEAKKKPGVRKVARKQQFYNNNNNENNYASSTTAAPVSSTTQHYNNNNNYYNSYNSRRNNNHNEATSSSPSTTVRPIDDYNKQFNVKHNIQTSTHRPSSTAQQTFSTYQVPSTTVKAPVFNNNNNNHVYGNQKSNTLGLNTPTTAKSVTYNQNFQYSPSTPRSTSYSQNYQDKYNNQDTQFNQNSRTPSTTVAPSTNYQQTDYTHFQQRNYNNIQRSTSTTIFPSTTAAYVDNNSNKFNSKSDGITSSRTGTSQTTKFYPNYSANNFAPTTYSPITTKKNNDNNGQYRDSNIQSSKSTQYFDSTKPPKKNNQYNNYDNNNNSGKYFETSTANYDFVRSQGIGFSPSSINLLAETPKTTTLAPRRTAAPTTYNPNNFNYRGSQQYSTTPRGSTYNSGSTRPFSSTPTFTDDTTSKPKSTKKNDYDYAYYDNVGALEYDGLDLENVARNKESSKIARN